MRAPLLLLCLTFAAFWPQLSFPEWRGTEARRVQIAYEMVQSGDWLVPTLGGEVTLAKPPLHYWVLAAVMELGGVRDLKDLGRLDPRWLRLPSLLAFWGFCWLVYEVLRRSHGTGAGWLSAIGILLSPVILHEAPTAEIDPLFACATGASILLAARGAAFGRRGSLVAGGVLGGAALLIKGPPYLMFLAGPLLVWVRHLRLSGLPYFALPLLLVPLCYYLPLGGAVGWKELTSVAGEESVGRALTYGWQHVVETPLYLLGACTLFLPLGFWTLHEYRYRQSRDAHLQPDEILLRFCSVSAVVAVLVLAVFPDRPTRYLLPAVPLFLAALGPALAHYVSRDRPVTRLQHLALAGCGILGSIALVALPFLPFPMPGRSIGLALVLALAPAVLAQRQIVAYVLLVPLAAAWTVLPDRGDHFVATRRGTRDVGEAIAREVDRLGASDLESKGHVQSSILLYAGLLPPGDELMRRQPEARWLLYEDFHEIGAVEFEGYVDRVRVKAHDRTLVLEERR